MNVIKCLSALVITLCVNASSAVSNERNSKYEMPALMMVTWAEWPDDPKQQDVMAQFIRSNGFNSVEVEIDKLEMCRRNELYARLGDGDLNRLLKNAEKLKDDKTIEENQKIKQLENVIEILENEIKYISSINDSIEIENKKFEPFVDQIDGDYDILYTISKDLKNQIENNRNLRTENNLLIDSIKKIKNSQEQFKLEYLNKIIAIEKNDTINKNEQ